MDDRYSVEAALRLSEDARQAKVRAELRDRFAMAALTGMCAHPSSKATWPWETGLNQMAEMAYRHADALLKAREANHD